MQQSLPKAFVESTSKSSTSVIMLVLMFMSFGSLLGKHCPTVSGLNSPISILQSHVNGLLKWVSPNNTADQVSLVLFNEQKIDLAVYRFIFKVTTEANKIFYIGVLSQITPDSAKTGDPVHNVLRFIQSTDLRDSRRLLGIYDVHDGLQESCPNLKEDFGVWMRQKGLRFNGDDLTKIEEPVLKTANSMFPGESAQKLQSQHKPTVNGLQLPTSHGVVNSSKDNSLITSSQKILSGNNDHQTPRQKDPLNNINQSSNSSQRANRRRTSYMIGTVLSGTGKDKIYQNTDGDNDYDSARLLQLQSNTRKDRSALEKKGSTSLVGFQVRSLKHNETATEYQRKDREIDDKSSCSDRWLSRHNRGKRRERIQKKSGKEPRFHPLLSHR